MKAARKRAYLAAAVIALFLVGSISLAWAEPAPELPRAQVSPTPVQLQLPTTTATPGPPTATPTRTPTSAGRPQVEALADGTNVRAGPDISETRLGQIYPGMTFAVLGKRFQWYWIEFPDSPNGTAWVHESVVRVLGEAGLIEEIDLESIPTVDAGFLAAQQTAEAITATPGAAATLTAQAQITPTGIFTAEPGSGPVLAPGQPLPTFTFPPFTVTPVAFPRTNPATTADTALAPIVFILALGALGMVGLLVSLMRRL
jgi:hypothetical protein